MKITKKIFSAVFATALVLCLASCSSQFAPNPEDSITEQKNESTLETENDSSEELTVEQEETVKEAESLTVKVAEVIAEEEVTEEVKTEEVKFEEKPALDPALFGTWQFGYYSDVINFSNDACYGRVNLCALGSKGTLSEGGVYSASNGIIKVVAYDVETGDKAPLTIVETTHTYKIISRSCIEFDGKKYYRVR